MKYPTANITYGGWEDKGLTIQVKDTSNPKQRWIIRKSDRENPDIQNEVYATLQNYKPGETFGVTYGEKEKSFTGREGNTITYKERTIYSILPQIANPTSEPTPAPSQQKTPHYEANTASGGKPDEFWDKKAYKQCLWGYWLKSAPSYVDTTHELTTEAKDLVWHVFKQIEEDADKRFSVSEAKPTEPIEDVPFTDDEAALVAGVPF